MRITTARFFVYATDLARSLQFYTEILQLTVVERVLGGTVLQAGSMQFEVLQERREEAVPMDRRTGLTLFVDHAETAFAQLMRHDVTVLAELEVTADGSRVFYVADPDGLPIGIVEAAPPELPPPAWILDEQ